MLECTICGLLSLNTRSCPACGSQNLVDLTDAEADPSMPSEVPGLDDAVTSLHELEGTDKTVDLGDIQIPTKDASLSNSSLPFGYSGQSNVHLSRLPFGIGSHAEGVPFEKVDNNEFNKSSDVAKVVGAEAVFEEANRTEIEKVVEVVRPMAMVRVEPLEVEEPITQEVVLDDVQDDQTNDLISIPEEWRLSVKEPDLDAIYSSEDVVVEVVHSLEDDVIMYNHQDNNDSTNVVEEFSPLQDSTSLLSLELHPAKAMYVDIKMNSDLTSELENGYFAIAKNSWAEAAISFQKIAARMPGDSAVFNNYGLALLQRAIEMAKDKNQSIQILASSQFESAILALREAAKSAPDESTILLNLAHALLVSGRAEKALKIIEVHNNRDPSSLEGINLEAAALVSIGQSISAKNKLSNFKGDAIIEENLSRLL